MLTAILLACQREPTIDTVAGIGGVSMAGGDGLPARKTGLYMPTAITFDPEGRLVIDDFNNFKVRRLEADGTLRTIVGWGVHGWASIGADPLESDLENAIDASYLPDGGLLLAELHAGRILVVHDTIEVFARGYLEQLGNAGDGGPATSAWLSEARGVTAGDDGRVWISDTDNQCVRVVEVDGTIHHVAGGPEPGFADGGSEDARFAMPERLRVAPDGGVWVADTQNHAIRRIDPQTFEVETMAGTGEEGFSGDGGPATAARLASPTGVWPLEGGDFLIADSENHRVRLVRDGVIETLAGTGTAAFSGDGGKAIEATLNFPADLRAQDGEIYVADMLNGAIRVIHDAL